MTSMPFYKEGEYIIVNHPENNKKDIGRIVKIDEEDSTVEYIQYYKPEETHRLRLPYHGTNEVFKTDISQTVSRDQIERRIEVCRMEKYILAPLGERLSNDMYVVRQFYDPYEKKFSEELEPECFCDKILNPDEELYRCECDRYFHKGCISPDKQICPTCNSRFPQFEFQSSEPSKKQKVDENTIELQTEDIDEMQKIFLKTFQEVAVSKNNPKLVKTNSSTGRSDPPNLKRNLSDTQNKTAATKPTQIKKPAQKKEFANISDEACKRIDSAIENFQKSHFNRTMSELEKSRYYIKEKFFKALLYGVEEVKEKMKTLGSHLYLPEAERGIALKEDRENYKIAQNISLNIEATVWHAVNKHKGRIDPNYSMKCREILNYLNDNANYELRLHILLGEKKPEFLCQASGKELLSTELSQNLEKKEKILYKQSLLSDEVKLVIKSHKGEEIIDTHEPVPEPQNPVETEVQEPQTPPYVNENGKNSLELDDDEFQKSDPSFLDAFEDSKPFQKQSSTPQANTTSNNKSDESSTVFKHSHLPIKTGPKTIEDHLNLAGTSHANRLVDYDLLKTLANYQFDKVYGNITSRLKQHLPSEISERIVSDVNSKLK